MTAQDFFNKVQASGVLTPAWTPKYGDQIASYIRAGIDQVASPDTGECWLDKNILNLFDAARLAYASPIQVTAGSRTVAHEDALRQAGYPTAQYASPHTLSALDTRPIVVAADLVATVQIWKTALLAAAQNLNLPTPRIGTKLYNGQMLHVDMVFLFFAPHTALPHPADWPELPQSLRSELGASWRPGVTW